MTAASGWGKGEAGLGFSGYEGSAVQLAKVLEICTP